MDGLTHIWVCVKAKALLPEGFQVFLQQEWDWLECAVTLPDSHLRYDTTNADELDTEFKKRFPVHRYNCDAQVPHGYGLVGQAWRYFEGSISFIQDCRDGVTSNPNYYYGQTAFYMGMLCHFIGDLCTPVHVGSRLDHQLVELFGNYFHQRIEARLRRVSQNLEMKLMPSIQPIPIGRSFFESIARDFAYPIYQELPSLVANLVVLDKQLARVLLRSVKDTATAWVSLLTAGKFQPRTTTT